MSREGTIAPDPVLLAYVRAPARPGMRMLALDDLPIIDSPVPAGDLPRRRWPVPLVVSQHAELAEGKLDGAVGNVVCRRCGTVLAQRITWGGSPAVIGVVRGWRWSRARSWRMPASAIIAARHRAQWFCLLDRPTTPAHLPLTCRNHGPMSVASSELAGAPPREPLAVRPPGDD